MLVSIIVMKLNCELHNHIKTCSSATDTSVTVKPFLADIPNSGHLPGMCTKNDCGAGILALCAVLVLACLPRLRGPFVGGRTQCLFCACACCKGPGERKRPASLVRGRLNRSRIDPPTESKLGACPGSLGVL